MTKPRIGQSGNWDRERADRLQEDVERMQKDVERLERWKVEACEVMNGLQELGKALGLRPGVQITGPAALAEVTRLTAERDAAIERLERVIDQWRKTGRAVISEMNRADKAEAERDALAQIKRHIDEVRNGTGWTVQIYGVLLQQCDQYGTTIDTRRAERAEAERDALAAQVAEGIHLTDVWASDLATDAMVNVMDGAALEAINEQMKRLLDLRAALAGSEADTADVDVCSGDADCTSELHVHGCFADSAGPCTDPDEHQPTEQEDDRG